MQSAGKFLVFQTAFPGDVILSTPLVQVLHEMVQDITIDVVAIPSAANALENHPAINRVVVYDKRKTDRGIAGMVRLIRDLRRRHYDVALIPHRSLRSGFICYLAGIPRRIGFSSSAATLLMTDVVPYNSNEHEIIRTLKLLEPLQVRVTRQELPRLYPSTSDADAVERFLDENSPFDRGNMIALAPGSVWATKRWLPERFTELAMKLSEEHFSVVLIGGKEDENLGHEIKNNAAVDNIVNAIGRLSLLQSADLIRRCRVLVSNDSAPMHIAVAMRTPVVALYGATVPEFGFAPLGEHDHIVQTLGLPCRPCAIHGGNHCPIKTFVCMKNIQTEDVLDKIHAILLKIPAYTA